MQPTQAKPFSLYDSDDQIHTLNTYIGKKIILFFYPKDSTPGCTIEACSFRNNSEAFQNNNIVLLGIGKGDIHAHKKFKTKYKLSFPLLIDQNYEVAKAYGVYKEFKMFGKAVTGIRRTTFLIDEAGFITKIWENVDPLSHVASILTFIQKEKASPAN